MPDSTHSALAVIPRSADTVAMTARLHRFFAALPRRLFPPRCALCDEPCSGRDLCAGCLADLPRPGPACASCGEPCPAGGGRCVRCRRLPPPMSHTRTVLRYEFPADWLITELKFNARLWHGPLLADLLADDLAARPVAFAAGPVVVPVPLHRRRLAERGYNQAGEIARPLASRLGWRIDESLLIRGRATLEQSSLSARARRRNVAGAFDLLRRPDFRHAVVVDDVVTTGATAREVAGLLRRAGVATVTVLAAARAL